MNRSEFIKSAGLAGAGLMLSSFKPWSLNPEFPVVRVAPAKRNFSSPAIEKAIQEFKSNVKNKELGWLFENAFPNTLDTTVFLKAKGANADTYVITGDIDAMW